MNKDYTIFFKEEYTRIGVFLVPHNTKIMKKSLFTIKIGNIDLDAETHTFRCLDSDRMTLKVMESILSKWREWEVDRERSPI